MYASRILASMASAFRTTQLMVSPVNASRAISENSVKIVSLIDNLLVLTNSFPVTEKLGSNISLVFSNV